MRPFWRREVKQAYSYRSLKITDYRLRSAHPGFAGAGAGTFSSTNIANMTQSFIVGQQIAVTSSGNVPAGLRILTQFRGSRLP